LVSLGLGYTACRPSANAPQGPGPSNTTAEAELRQFAISGELPHLDRAAAAVKDSRRAAPWDHNRAGLALAIRVDLASHRFAEAKNDAQKLRLLLPGYGSPLLFLGDALFNLGAISEAERLWYEPEAQEEGPLSIEPRLAQVDLVYGRVEAARTRLENALERAKAQSPPDPLQVAWSATLLGELFFRMGDWESAERFYQEALTVLPAYYAALDHLAELRGAQGRTDEAVRLYEGLVDKLRRPEFYQALGDLYAYAGRAKEAQPWYHRALDAYLESAGRKGEVLYFHHLSGFYADSLSQAAEAVKWARKDLQLRQTIQAYDSLAWALSKEGSMEDARAAAGRALATGTRDPHILYHAGLILMGSGDIAAGEARLKQAALENPRFSAFHEHR
jgi:tetratricopeptide (TPR) repeat protein